MKNDVFGWIHWQRRGEGASSVPESFPEPELDATTPFLNWEDLHNTVRACTRCPLHTSRTQTVFGVGDRDARLVFVGEAPGAQEDLQGEPFVGRAGKLLDAMLHAIGLQRTEIYILNILKCRPPNNRDPTPEEVQACSGYLEAQLKFLNPSLLVALVE